MERDSAKADDEQEVIAMPRYTICPYYIDDNKKTVSCEDVIRRFATYRSKNKHMNKFCDKDWKECPHAMVLSEMYHNMESAPDPAKLQVRALEKENKKLISLLGRYDVRLDAKDAEIRRIRKKNEELEQKLYKKRKEMRDGKEREQESSQAKERLLP